LVDHERRPKVTSENGAATEGWRVKAPARLHFGFMDLNGSLGRRFGSIGVALEEPFVELTLHPAPTLEIWGPEAARIERYAATAAAHLGVALTGRFELRTTIPAHAGLGSGTQLALSVAELLARLNGIDFDAARMAAALDRGGRSGLGLAAFREGGLVLDGGRGSAGGVPPVLSRFDFPQSWRIILAIDESSAGLHGPHEASAFESLPLFSEAEAADLCRLALMKILPAAATRDIVAFGSGISELQRRIGDYFAPAQGGRFASKQVAVALAELEAQGAAGIGQSSWGPTGYALAASRPEAERLIAAVAPVTRRMKDLRLVVVRGRNRGAETTSFTSMKERLRAGTVTS
jgi:beta-ribofuranosylaminobenzene 5'-phosphate synthase